MHILFCNFNQHQTTLLIPRKLCKLCKLCVVCKHEENTKTVPTINFKWKLYSKISNVRLHDKFEMSGFMTNLIKNYLKAQKIKCVIQKMSKMYLLTCLNNNLRCMYPNLVSGVSSLSVIICNHCPICCVYGETGCYLCEVVKVMLSCGETAINTDAFWLSSLHEACVWNVFF